MNVCMVKMFLVFKLSAYKWHLSIPPVPSISKSVVVNISMHLHHILTPSSSPFNALSSAYSSSSVPCST